MPTVYELASLAAQVYQNSADAKSAPEAVLVARQIWEFSKVEVSQIETFERGQKELERYKNELLKSVKTPKQFPISIDKMIQLLLPKRSVEDRNKIRLSFCASITEFAGDAFTYNFEEPITESRWRHFLFLFNQWFPAYKKVLRIEKARKAALSKNKKRV